MPQASLFADASYRLDVSASQRLGVGWATLGEKERMRGLEFAETDNHYRLDLPAATEPNEFLINLAKPGNAARLTNTGPGCQLEARPLITTEEMQSGKIVRSLIRTGQTLIALFSTDSTFAGSVSPPGADGFWSDALRLVNVVSTAAWEKKVLARAQAPGSAPKQASFGRSARRSACWRRQPWRIP